MVEIDLIKTFAMIFHITAGKSSKWFDCGKIMGDDFFPFLIFFLQIFSNVLILFCKF